MYRFFIKTLYIEKLECLSSSETSNSIFINKLTFKNKNIRLISIGFAKYTSNKLFNFTF